MPSSPENPAGVDQNTFASACLVRQVGHLAGRLEEFLGRALRGEEGAVARGRAFLKAAWEQSVLAQQFAGPEGSIDCPPSSAPSPIDRLRDCLRLSAIELDLLLLAGLPEEHEGFADLFCTLHPTGQPRATAGLAAQFLGKSTFDRRAMRELIAISPLIKAGAIVIDGNGPLFTRNLLIADTLWPVLHGIDVWPERITPVDGPVALHGLSTWLAEPPISAAIAAIKSGMPCTVLVTADNERIALHRGRAMAAAAGSYAVALEIPSPAPADLGKLIYVHMLSRGAVPVLRLRHNDGPEAREISALSDHPGPVIVCARAGSAVLRGTRPLLGVACERLSAAAQTEMWRQTLPQLAEYATTLAARYPLEPYFALQIAGDIASIASIETRRAQVSDVGAAVRTRTRFALGGGVKLVQARAKWKHLVLRRDRLAQLREALDRLVHQARVLDEWGFLEGRRGARGVRMLFSGASGTGKTLSAEVLAGSLETDLLVVDLSRVVSKWIGETEKNLAEVFETAENARAVLFFDEADALFGRRTEVSDAHDRYANLESAYLLGRFEQFEGLVILSTNLRQNIDPAFTRRLEFVLEFEEPGRAERLALWECHLPQDAPLADDVSLPEMAACYPIVGGLIRNAAAAAAFLAAADGSRIRRAHFIRAIQREYEKIGKPFPGTPGKASTRPREESCQSLR